jgi:hypothetical protein
MADGRVDLTTFFEALETNFPLSGVRVALSKKVGPETVTVLERAGLLTLLRESDTYPCPHPGGPGCPRQVVRHSDDDGRITAVCGNDPPECEDVELTPQEIEVLGVLPVRLCEALRAPLLFGGKTENVTGLNRVLRAGTFQPRPGVRKSVYFAARCSANDYGVLLDALRSRHRAEGFAFLVPTDRFVSEESIQESAARGIVVLPLVGLIDVDSSGKLVASVDAAELFTRIGRTGLGPVTAAETVFAQVLTRDGWHNLDEVEYEQLARNADSYDIFADEHTKEVRKKEAGMKAAGRKGAKTTPPSRASANYFQIIRKAVEARGYFDPTVAEEKDSGKQIFQRAREALDIKEVGADGKPHWKLFKSVKVDNRTVYQFQPDEGVTFALIFLPKA